MYAKVFSSMFKGSMYGNPDGIITFMVMLVLADPEGIVDMTPQAISAVTSIPLDLIQRGITYLSRPDSESRTPDMDGKRIALLDNHRNWGWFIVNFKKYREMRSAEERRQYYREWKRNSRQQAKSKPSRSVTDASRSTLSTSRPLMSTMSTDSESDAESYSDTEAVKKVGGRAARSTATHLPADFELTDDRKTYAVTENIDPAREFAKFCDYWRAASGAAARKRDWDAAWRGWCRKAADFKPAARIANKSFSTAERSNWVPPEMRNAAK